MVAWSSFALRNISKCSLSRRAFVVLKNQPDAGHEIKNAVCLAPLRGHKTMTIVPSRYTWNKFKDMTHFYLLLGAIPLLLVVFYCNVFIGPATLAVIPEGYEPKNWEYYQHPITRFFAKHFTMSPQESHERNIHNLFRQHERFLIRQLEKKIEQLMKERLDYEAYYVRSRPAKYEKLIEEIAKENEENLIQVHGMVK